MYLRKIIWIACVFMVSAYVFITNNYTFEYEFLFVTALSFLFEFINGATGMGFGTLSAQAFIWMNFSPSLTVQNILISELITGFVASYFHSGDKNINFFTPRNRLATLIITFGCVLGVFIGVPTAMKMQKDVLIASTGVVTIICGLIILFMLNVIRRYSHSKMMALSTIAAFNKSLTGGGFGALLTSGQIIGGLEGKSAAAITSFAKGITGGIGIVVYLANGSQVELKYLLAILVGSFLAVPFATGFIKKFDERQVKKIIAIVTLIMGTITLLKGLHYL